MNCRSPWNKKTFPTGIEPAHTASEADALSTELRELHHEYTITVKIFQNISEKKIPGCARALLSRIQVKPTSSLNLPLTNTRPTLQGDDNVLPRTSKAHRL